MHNNNNKDNNNKLVWMLSLLLEKAIKCLLNFKSSDSFEILPWISEGVQISFSHTLLQLDDLLLSPSNLNYPVILVHGCNWLMMLWLHILSQEVSHCLAVVVLKVSNYWSKE